MNKIDLALVELNIKYATMMAWYNDVVNAHDYVVNQLQADLERITELAGRSPLFDSNYSNTWGFNTYGMYENLSEMEDVEKVVSAGF